LGAKGANEKKVAVSDQNQRHSSPRRAAGALAEQSQEGADGRERRCRIAKERRDSFVQYQVEWPISTEKSGDFSGRKEAQETRKRMQGIETVPDAFSF
jgi:hypothetical protein